MTEPVKLQFQLRTWVGEKKSRDFCKVKTNGPCDTTTQEINRTVILIGV